MTTVQLLALFVFLQTPASPVLEQGRALTTFFYRGDVDALWARFSPEMKKGLGSADNLRGFRAQVETQAGIEESVVDENVESAEGFQVYKRIARFSKAPVRVMVQWTLAADGQGSTQLGLESGKSRMYGATLLAITLNSSSVSGSC